MGIAYAHDGKLIIYKTLTSLSKLIRKYKKARELNAPCLIHFRIATHGEIHERNCHPFNLTNNLVFAHNGTIIVPGVNRGRAVGSASDSAVFGKRILKPLNKSFPQWRDSTLIRGAIKSYISGSKLVFLDALGRIDIIGVDKGYWDNSFGGAWFSNLSYVPYNKLLTYHKYLIPVPDDPKKDRPAPKTILLPQKAGRMTLSPTDSPKQSGDSVTTHGIKPSKQSDICKLYSEAGLLLPDKNLIKGNLIMDGWQYEGQTYCYRCLPMTGVASSSLIELYDEGGAVHICSVCGRGLSNDCH